MTAALLALNARTFASLRRHRNYRLFFSGQVISVSGTWMQNIGLAWLVVELTHSPLAVGLLAFCRFIPFTIFGLFAGVVADRIDNRKLVIGTQTISMILSAILAVLVLSGSAALWSVYVLAVLSSTAIVFDAPGRHALTFQMVGREELPNAVALNASLFNGSRVIGPALAGVIIAAWGVGACFAINTISFLAVLAGLLAMRREELVPVRRDDEPPTMMRGIGEGLAYAWRAPQVRLVLAMVTVVSTVGFNFHVLLPLLASETLRTGPEVFGILSATFGAGALLGALLSAALGRASWKVLVLGTGGFSVSLLALAPVTVVWGCAALLFVTGVSFTLWTSNANSILQIGAPDHLRGRIVSLYLWAFAGLAPVGGLLAGWLVDVGGTPLSFSVAGAVGLAMTLLAATELRRRRDAARRRAILHASNMQATSG
ncbi:MAG: MFS transporter [Actinobacteria bacterium]|nr:MFS transporter [Actinomycetota bacterium]